MSKLKPVGLTPEEYEVYEKLKNLDLKIAITYFFLGFTAIAFGLLVYLIFCTTNVNAKWIVGLINMVSIYITKPLAKHFFPASAAVKDKPSFLENKS